mgnify:CR=1 FL=1
MPYKDPEKRREYRKDWESKNKEKLRMYQIRNNEKRRLQNNSKRRNGVHLDFKTHHELALNSGIQSQTEWWECHAMGLMPEGVVYHPERL